MAAFYPAFQLAIIAPNGERVPLPETDVHAYNVTQASALPDVVSDTEGRVAEGSFTANAGDVVRFSVDDHPETAQFTLQATQAEAYTAVENSVNTFIVENLYSVRNESRIADLYLIDKNDPAIPPQRIGSAKAGETAVIPHAVTAQKNYEAHLISRDVKGKQSATDFSQSREKFDITIPAPAGVKFESLFDLFEDRPTTGTSRETLVSYAMPTGVLDHEGDKIVAEYAGSFAANGNAKRVHLSFAGTDVFDSGALTENGTDWQLRATIIRASNSAARVAVSFASGVHHAPNYTEVASLDFDANGYDLELDATTGTGAGDAAAKMAHGTLFPRVPQTAFGMTLGGFSLAFTAGDLTGAVSQMDLGGFYLTFTPGNAEHYLFSGPPNEPDVTPSPFPGQDPILPGVPES